MTKLERAKRQTLERWEWTARRIQHVDRANLLRGIPLCGFCVEYNFPDCSQCPIFIAQGIKCWISSDYQSLLRTLKNNNEHSMLHALAVMVYIHGFTEADTRVLVGR